jgi:arylsulfatase
MWRRKLAALCCCVSATSAAAAASGPAALDAAVAAAQGFPVASPLPRSEASATKAVLRVVADDLGYSDLGYRGSQIATPVIDHLALHGVRLGN